MKIAFSEFIYLDVYWFVQTHEETPILYLCSRDPTENLLIASMNAFIVLSNRTNFGN